MGKANGPRRINHLLGSTVMAPLVRAVRAQPGTESPENPGKQALTDALPPALRDRCHLIMEKDELVMLAETSAVAQLLRFQGPRLAKQLGARRWQVRVRPPSGAPTTRTGAGPRPMPPQAAACLRDLAKNLEDDELADALRKLASHGEA